MQIRIEVDKFYFLVRKFERTWPKSSDAAVHVNENHTTIAVSYAVTEANTSGILRLQFKTFDCCYVSKTN
jgi:hypothetical protein